MVSQIDLDAGVEVGHPVSQRSVLDRLMHAASRTNVSVNGFLALGQYTHVALMILNHTMTQ